MFPPRVSVKLTKSKVREGGGVGLVLLGQSVILTCSFRWLEGRGEAGGGAPAHQYTLFLLWFDPEGLSAKNLQMKPTAPL